MIYSARSRAKKKGIEFDIVENDIVIPENCPVLGIPLISSVGVGPKINSPTLDRVDVNFGYVRGNVMVISWRANKLKSDGTIQEFKKLVKWMTQTLGYGQ